MDKGFESVNSADENEERKKSYIADNVALYISLVLTALVCVIIYNFSSVFDRPPEIKDHIIWGFLKPEPVERLMFLAAIVLFPSLFFLIRYLNERVKNKAVFFRSGAAMNFFAFFGAVSLALLAYYALTAELRHSGYRYINGTLAENNSYLYAAAVLFMSALLFRLYRSRIAGCLKNSKLKKTYFIFDVFIFVFLAAVSLKYVHQIRDDYHFEAIFYSMSQVFNGNTVFVDFTGQYGAYAHFLEPVFRLMGGLSVWNFRFVMSVLIVVSFFSLYVFMRMTVKNKFILFVSFIALVFYSYIMLYHDFRGREYYQYFPVRTIFPAVFLLLSMAYFKTKNTALYYIVPVFASFGILWNPDTGIVCVGAWLLTLGYAELRDLIQKHRKTKLFVRKLIFHIVNLTEIIISVLILWGLIIFFRSGDFPDYSGLIKYQKIYYAMGFGAVPMQLIHPWNLAAAAFIIGLAKSISGIFDGSKSREEEVRNTMIFLLAVLGAGLFAYFQGRSHDWALVPVLYIPVILAAIFSDLLLNESRKHFIPGKFFIFVFLLFLLGAPMSNFVSKLKAGPFKELPRKFDSRYRKGALGFLKTYFKEGEEVYVISKKNQAVIYAETGAVSPINVPGQNEITLASDMKRLRDYLKEKKKDRRLIWDLSFGGEFVNHYNLHFTHIYKPEAIIPGSHIEIYKQYDEIENTGFVFDNEDYVFHCKQYNGVLFTYINSKGEFEKNFHHDPGEELSAGREFTIEMLIKPSGREKADAKVISCGAKGGIFELKTHKYNFRHDKKNLYCVGCGKDEECGGNSFVLEPGKTVYLALVFENGAVDVYKNGEKTMEAECKIPKGWKQFRMPYKFSGFTGDIKELKISDRIKTGREISNFFSQSCREFVSENRQGAADEK